MKLPRDPDGITLLAILVIVGMVMAGFCVFFIAHALVCVEGTLAACKAFGR